jgi:hypothetical protein
MSDLNAEKLPADVLERAIYIIRTQGPTPSSPGERRDGGVALCAAAAIASAGLELAGLHQRRAEFEEGLVASKSTDPIRQVFEEFGWSVGLCNRTVASNDEFDPRVREESVVKFLRGLPTM